MMQKLKLKRSHEGNIKKHKKMEALWWRENKKKKKMMKQ